MVLNLATNCRKKINLLYFIQDLKMTNKNKTTTATLITLHMVLFYCSGIGISYYCICARKKLQIVMYQSNLMSQHHCKYILNETTEQHLFTHMRYTMRITMKQMDNPVSKPMINHNTLLSLVTGLSALTLLTISPAVVKATSSSAAVTHKMIK